MGKFQRGIVAEANSSAIFLTLNQVRRPGALEKLRSTLATVPTIEREFDAEHPAARVSLVAAIGCHYWSQLCPDRAPAKLAPFPCFENGERVAPRTPADLLFHIRSDARDINFDIAGRLRELLGDAVDIVEEVECFRYHDSRDLIGFVDGTENPQGEDRVEVAVVGDEDPEFSGGCYIHLQRYVHNLDLWNQQPVDVQEQTIGRTKADNIEFARADKSPNAHTLRASLKDPDGQSLQILRHSMPYGDSSERGLVFASYCATPKTYEQILGSMILGDDAGNCDDLLRYTRAVTGQAFFAPAVDWLVALG